ncbi:uncharacterized protein LOC124271419 [Haliotis rubra]|uniref:uncharacterized protein LOC124271419 n=1 Tax=Haliotis rubra TaxID=36100 RepID=UPI001EE536BF|nr:uncharacterized protein LOC124271419 [Haliotis rubra]
MTLLLSCLLLALCPLVTGHGYLFDPPSRSTMWRKGFNTPINYNDNQLFCGGNYNENFVHHGKCGICGDPWQGPRDNEAGGKYATGTISKTYQSGDRITIQVIVTANHMGWFEFKLCPNNNPAKAATKECLDAHVLHLTDSNSTKYYITSDTGPFNINVQLPSGLTCTQCVLQWRWKTGNSYGVDPDGRACIGCGLQEEFYGCADVAITGDGSNPITAQPGTQRPITTQKPYQPTQTPKPYQPIVTAQPYQPIKTQKPYQPVETPKPYQPIQTQAPATNGGQKCFGVNNWAGVPSLDRWCTLSCAAGHCLSLYCKCV